MNRKHVNFYRYCNLKEIIEEIDLAKALEQDAASAAEDNALHIRAALKRMIVIENGEIIDQPPQQQADDHTNQREPVEINQQSH